MSSRIEQIIEEIEEYVDSCKFQPLSTTKIVVNKEELEELLRELRLKTPDEMTSWEFFDSLLWKAHVVGTPGSGFGPCGEHFFRLTAFGSLEDTLRAMERIRKFSC